MVLKHFFDQVLDFFNSISKVLYSFFAIIIVRARCVRTCAGVCVVCDVTTQINFSNLLSSTWIKNFCGVWVDVADVSFRRTSPISEAAVFNTKNNRYILINEIVFPRFEVSNRVVRFPVTPNIAAISIIWILFKVLYVRHARHY